jgi:hypothetical protein
MDNDWSHLNQTVYEKSIGSMHPAFAKVLSQLSEIYLAKGLLSAAEPLLQQSLDIRRATCRRTIRKSPNR